MSVDGIFLISSENKDKYCLDPIAKGLESRFAALHFFDFFEDITSNNGKVLSEFARSKFPVAIISSAIMVDFLSLIRPRETFLCVGVEHGIAPFKTYTYGKHLLSSDFYLAPTKGWAERLARLYPESRPQIRIGGYPKLEVIKGRIERRSSAEDMCKRILVILSWGVAENAFEFLPDLEFIDYVLHPADYKLKNMVLLSNAGLHVSSPDVTYDLISSASLVIGDFSSLTLECIHLGKHVVFMVDRSIYNGNCDMDASFFNDVSPEFGVIPESGTRIAIEGAITVAEFASLVARFGDDIEEFIGSTKQAEFDQAFLPPADRNNIDLCVDELCKLFDVPRAWRGTGSGLRDETTDAVESMCFIWDSYQTLLGRPADRGGLRHYLRRMAEFNGSVLHKAVAVWHEISSSPEAKRQHIPDTQELPRIYFPADPVKLAHAHAAEERLSDALYWITKALERQPDNGEFHRFKASILERMGLFEQALGAAQDAGLRGADSSAIAFDIERIGHRLVGSIEDNSASLDAAVSLPASARLLVMGRLPLGKTIRLLANVLMASLKNLGKSKEVGRYVP